MLALEEVLEVIQRHLVYQVLLIGVLGPGRQTLCACQLLSFVLEVLALFYVVTKVVQF